MVWRVPDTTFYMRERDESVGGDNPFAWVIKRASDLFAGKKVVIFGLPGAFTPTCTLQQLPTYEAMYEQFAEQGIDEIWCTSVNDAFVMFQWAKSLGVEKVKMLPDGNGDFAKALDMLVDKSNLGFGKRSWRYSMIVDDLNIKEMFAEDHWSEDLCPTDPYENSDPRVVLEYLKTGKRQDRDVELD